MSATEVKQIRRDLRRAFGPEALAVIDAQGSALEAQGNVLDALAKNQITQDRQIAFLTKELADMRSKFAGFGNIQ